MKRSVGTHLLLIERRVPLEYPQKNRVVLPLHALVIPGSGFRVASLQDALFTRRDFLPTWRPYGRRKHHHREEVEKNLLKLWFNILHGNKTCTYGKLQLIAV